MKEPFVFNTTLRGTWLKCTFFYQLCATDRDSIRWNIFWNRFHTSLALSHLTHHLINCSLYYFQECTYTCSIHQTAADLKILKNVFRGWKKTQAWDRNTWTQGWGPHSGSTEIFSPSAPGTWCSVCEGKARFLQRSYDVMLDIWSITGGWVHFHAAANTTASDYI